MSDYGAFLRGLLDHPRDVSAPTPSSPALAAVIAAQVDPAVEGLVVELGPGTGVVTKALLDRGVAPARLQVIENNEFFVGVLTRRFPGVSIIHGDAMHFEAYLPQNAKVAAIVSGLPLLNFATDTRRDLIERALCRQSPRGRFVQLSYGWQPAVPANGLFFISKIVVWRNFPPAHVWTYRRRGAAETQN
jgi:phosphatidylethanolamine/phosphatidyl-N-methylethanolamine N-methyltransferase